MAQTRLDERFGQAGNHRLGEIGITRGFSQLLDEIGKAEACALGEVQAAFHLDGQGQLVCAVARAVFSGNRGKASEREQGADTAGLDGGGEKV